jgi:hypothetical protein
VGDERFLYREFAAVRGSAFGSLVGFLCRLLLVASDAERLDVGLYV